MRTNSALTKNMACTSSKQKQWGRNNLKSQLKKRMKTIEFYSNANFDNRSITSMKKRRSNRSKDYFNNRSNTVDHSDNPNLERNKTPLTATNTNMVRCYSVIYFRITS